MIEPRIGGWYRVLTLDGRVHERTRYILNAFLVPENRGRPMVVIHRSTVERIAERSMNTRAGGECFAPIVPTPADAPIGALSDSPDRDTSRAAVVNVLCTTPGKETGFYAKAISDLFTDRSALRALQHLRDHGFVRSERDVTGKRRCCWSPTPDLLELHAKGKTPAFGDVAPSMAVESHDPAPAVWINPIRRRALGLPVAPSPLNELRRCLPR